jgi:hypothetical protein
MTGSGAVLMANAHCGHIVCQSSRAGIDAIRIRFVPLHGRQCNDLVVTRRKMTDRIGSARVAGNCKRLATAAAEVDIAPLAAAAWLLHPIGAAESVEGG